MRKIFSKKFIIWMKFQSVKMENLENYFPKNGSLLFINGFLFGSIIYIAGIVYANLEVDKTQKSLEFLMKKQLELNQIVINKPENDLLKLKTTLDSTINDIVPKIGTEYWKTFLSWGYFAVDNKLILPDTSNYPSFIDKKKSNALKM